MDQVCLLWTHLRPCLYSSVSLNILREVCDYLRFLPSLAFFSQSALEVRYFPGYRVKTVQLGETPVGCIIAHMSFEEILCVGTYPTSKSVSSVHLIACVLKKEADMSEPRNSPGVIRAYDFVYVFGGYTGRLITASSEKFSITHRDWKQLPDMNSPRVYFSPALYNNDIYLCDPATQSTLSSFNIITETYTVHSVTIPTVPTNASVSFIAGEELFVVMLPCTVFRWRLGSPFPFVIVESKERKLQGFSCTEVLQIDRSIYWTDYNAKRVIKFGLDTLLDYDYCT